MHASRCLRAFVVGAVIGSAVTVVAGAGGTNREARFIAALGASISAGAATEPGPELANSWATGTNPKVNSIYLRLRERNGSGVRAFNAAAPGAYMSDIQYEATGLPKGVDLVTVADVGANVACDAPTTSAALFGSQLEDGLRAIAARAPAARIVVVSILDEVALWDAVKRVPEARLIRSFCKLATTASGRRAVRKETGVLNHELETVCARHPKCRYDGGAVFRIRWSRADVSLDYYHPSVAGQRKIAAAVWASGAITRN